MLSEVLCKIMSTNLVRKVLNVLYVTRVLDPSRQRHLAGRVTGSASLLVINMISNQSSFDEEKALIHEQPAYGVIGVKTGCATRSGRWLARMDVDRTTVAKTPYAQAVWELLPYRCVKTPGTRKRTSVVHFC